jgi:DNA (cytosine-5)-methyltransferase 1
MKLIRIGTDCSGIEAPIQALKKMKINFSHEFACEIDKHARESIKANYKPKFLFEDMTKKRKLPDIDMYVCGFPCFVKGSKVLTDIGYTNIEDVTIDNKLLTHTGKFQSIVNKQIKEYTGEIYRIRCKYSPYEIKCTPEHPFYVKRDNKEQWIDANKITSKDYIGIPINNNSVIPKFEFQKKINAFKSKIIKVILDNKDQWFMMGYFLGDGWVEDTKKKDGRCMYKIRFAINNEQEEYVTGRIKNVLNITDKKCDTGKCKKFGCVNMEYYNILKHFGKYAKGKKIPEWVHDAPIDYIKEFILGYKTADGCDLKNKISYTTISYNIAFGIQRLYSKLGICCSVNYSKTPSTCIIEGRTVNQSDTYILRITKEYQRMQNSFKIENGYIWFKIKEINKNILENINVYNFEVEKDNSYCVQNAIVHNCQTFSTAGSRKGMGDPRGTIFYDCLKVIKTKKPKIFVLENVKGLLSHDKGETFKVIMKNLNKLKEYTIHYKVLNTKDYGIPQNRERVFIVGLKTSEMKYEFKFPKKKKMKKIKDYIDEKIKHKDEPLNFAKKSLKKSEAIFVDLVWINMVSHKSYSLYSPTITCNTRLWCVPKTRFATIKELLSLQGFTKSFKQVVSDKQMTRQIGNSMSINVLIILFKCIFKCF